MNKKGMAAAVLTAGLGVVYGLSRMKGTIRNIRRVNREGTLYEMEYTGDACHPLYRLPFRLMQAKACSAFATKDETGCITGRNYDMPHFDSKGNLTGLNAVVHMHPKGKYASVNVADLMWLKSLKIPYEAGILEKKGTLIFPLALVPYLCMDGMNEKGLTASILYLDVKPGEKAVSQQEQGLPDITITELLRYIIDQCATVDEAVALAKNYNMKNILGSDYHLFVSDASGKSAILEWRFNQLCITRSDACTNFYNGFDDAEDCYYGRTLKEEFRKPGVFRRPYRYGYGHGYERFRTVAQGLEEHVSDSETGDTQMSEEECMELLGKAAQTYHSFPDSMTQYSCVYHQSSLTMKICVQQDYEHVYTYEVKKGEKK